LNLSSAHNNPLKIGNYSYTYLFYGPIEQNISIKAWIIALIESYWYIDIQELIINVIWNYWSLKIYLGVTKIKEYSKFRWE